MHTFVQQFIAPHTVNGNPRRLFVVYGDILGNVIGVYEEGYLGRHAIPAIIRDGYTKDLPAINVNVKEYNRLLKMAPKDQIPTFE